jgi:4-amino-4-deoxy-L-arabinose transferase-like glycosyltransferase
VPPARTAAFVRALIVIAFAGVALRAVYLFAIARHVTGIGDWHFYHWQANLIADGRGFIDPFQYLFDHKVLPSAGHPPLYPLALSAVSLLGGESELSHRALGLLLGAATIVLVGLLGRRVGGERTGLIAAGLCAIYPLMIAVDGALMSETLYGPLIAGMLLCAYWLYDRPGLWPALALGAVIALAALTRTEALLFVPFLALPIAWRSGPGRWWRFAAVVGACVLVIAPWTIRNAVRFDAFVPISTNDSTVVAGANCPLTYHGVDLGGWYIDCISQRRQDNEARQAEIWRREGLDYARDHAGHLPAVMSVRLLRIWDFWQPRRQLMFAEGRDRTTEKAGVAAYYLLLVVAVLGVVELRRRRAPLLVLLAPAIVVCVSAVVGYGVPRLRHSFEIPLLVLAAVGLQALWARRPGARA